MKQEIPRLEPQLDGTHSQRMVERESAAIIAFTSAIAAYGAFFIPKLYGTSIDATGGPAGGALRVRPPFYVLCAGVTWFLTQPQERPGSLLSP